MSPRTTGWLALVALALGAFVYLYEIEGEVERKAAEDEAKRIHPGIEAEDIEAVTLTTRDGVPARFERREGRWELVTPLMAPADATALDAIASALADMPRAGTVETPADADASGEAVLEPFGLGEAARTIRFEVGGGTKGIRIGRSTPVGGHRYVARLEDDAVAYVESYRVNAFNRDLDDLRDRRIFGFASGDVRTLRLRWPASGGEAARDADFVELALARDDEGSWQIGAPLVAAADDAVVRDLLSDLAYLRAEDFLDEPAPAVDAALEQTALELHWTLDGDHLERSARIAGSTGEAHVIEGPAGRRYTIASERLEDFPRRLDAYRDKRLSAFEVSEARGLSLELREEGAAGDGAPGMRVEAELADAGWRSEPPRIDPDRASDLVRVLSNLQAVEILAEEMGPAERAGLGLEPPRARLRVEGAPGELLADVWLGRVESGRGLFARRGDAETIYLLPISVAGSLPISVERFETDFAASEEMAGSEEADADASVGDEGDAEAGGASPPDEGADPLEDLELP